MEVLHLNKTLVIIEVSQKQAYIFASNELKSNVQRSKEIAFVTSSEFFKLAAGDIYNEEKNLINAGGGHTVLQFDDEKTAEDFVYIVTKEVMTVFPEMEVFAKIKTRRNNSASGRTSTDLVTGFLKLFGSGRIENISAYTAAVLKSRIGSIDDNICVKFSNTTFNYFYCLHRISFCPIFFVSLSHFSISFDLI